VFRRRQREVRSRTSGQRMRAEFGEGMGHLALAARHGADSVGAMAGPGLRGVRAAALVPLAAAMARASVKAPKTKESKMSRKRTRLLAGLLAAGTVAGVTGALVARRRSRSRWEEYESQGRAQARTESVPAPGTTARDTDWATTGKQTARDWAASTKDSATAEKVADPLDLTAEHFADNASSASKNSRG
jgi:hypothetical protein